MAGNGGVKFVYLPVQIFIDELDMTPDTSGGNTGNALMGLNLSGIAYVKYIPGLVNRCRVTSTSGALYIYTKTGSEKTPSFKRPAFCLHKKAISRQRNLLARIIMIRLWIRQPDLRTTVYWNPNVLMDKTNNSIKIEFNNNDVSKKLLLKIEGVNAAGRLIYIEKILE